MGLDMYLVKMPRYKTATARLVETIECYFHWKAYKENEGDLTFQKLYGRNPPPKEYIDFYEKFSSYGLIACDVAYWRKANHIHEWFVNKVQNGVDDCQYHKEVTRKILVELLDACNKILDSCDVVNGKNILTDTSVAEKLLPTVSGLFFGNTKYDECYIASIEDTVDQIITVLETTNFETEMIYYLGDW